MGHAPVLARRPAWHFNLIALQEKARLIKLAVSEKKTTDQLLPAKENADTLPDEELLAFPFDELFEGVGAICLFMFSLACCI